MGLTRNSLNEILNLSMVILRRQVSTRQPKADYDHSYGPFDFLIRRCALRAVTYR